MHEQTQQEIFEGFAGIATKQGMREFFQDEGLVAEGDMMKPEDFAVICSRAAILERGGEVHGLEALKWAFLDRMAVNRETGVAILGKIKPSVIQDMYKTRFNEELPLEEVHMFIRHILAGGRPVSETDMLTDWQKAREAVAQSTSGVTAVVERDDGVVLVDGGTREAALKRAVDER